MTNLPQNISKILLNKRLCVARLTLNSLITRFPIGCSWQTHTLRRRIVLADHMSQSSDSNLDAIIKNQCVIVLKMFECIDLLVLKGIRQFVKIYAQ